MSPEVTFATKPTLTRTMLARAFAAGIPAAWVTGDSVYGSASKLGTWLQAERRSYVLAVTRGHHAVDPALHAAVPDVVAALPEDVWQRRSVGDGSKGPCVHDWALARLPAETEPGFGQWLLVRRSVAAPKDVAFYRVFGPEATTLEAMARVAGRRWVIEEGFERAKGEVGLDQYEVRRWEGWHRHITLCLLAHALLEVTRSGATADEKGGPAT